MTSRSNPISSPSATELTDDLRAKGRRRRETSRDLAGVEQRGRISRNDLLPELELVERHIDSLHAPKRKLRKLDPAHVRDVMSAIEGLGFADPILITSDGKVIDGVTRLEALRLLGQDRVPCVVSPYTSETDLRLLRLCLNRLAEKGTWDIEELRLEFEELVVLEAPIEISGFDLEQIDQILLDDDETYVEPGPVEPAPGAVATTRLGDVWCVGDHRLACGDARDDSVYVSLFEGGERARLVLTDQPFNVKISGHVTSGQHREFQMASGEMSDEEFQTFIQDWMRACLQHVIDGGLFATFVDWRCLLLTLQAALLHKLEQLNLVVWAKSNGGQGSLYRSGHELLPIWKFGKESHVNNIELGKHGRWRSNVWTAPGASCFGSDAREGLKLHPTVKPIALLEDALLDLTRRGEIVLDPFLGSGTTMVAADRTGRVCRGIELDPLYCDVIVQRLQEVTGKDATLLETGEPFTAVQRRRAEEEVR